MHTNTRLPLISLSSTTLLAALGNSIANVALPTLALAFDATFQQVQWVVLAYLLSITTLIVGVGALGDVLGRRPLLLAGMALFSIASLACALAPALPWLIAARALQGLGAAVMMALTMALVGDTVPKAETGRAMGLLATMSAAGTALGPTLGGTLIGSFGWPSLFYVLAGLGAMAAILAWCALPVPRPVSRVQPLRFDYAGTALLVATLGCYALAMTLGRGQAGLVNLVLLLCAAAGAALFAFVERRAPCPLIKLSMLREPGLRAGLAMSALVSTVVMALVVVGPFYLTGALHLTPAQMGLALAAGPGAAALTGLPAGRGVDRYGAPRVAIAGLALMVPGLLLLTVLPARLGVAAYVVSYCIVTAGYALFQTANNSAVMSDVAGARRGVMSGLLNMARNLGMVTGASLMGAVFAYGAGAAGIVDASAQGVTAGMRLTFGVSVALVVAALAIGLRRQPASIALSHGEN